MIKQMTIEQFNELSECSPRIVVTKEIYGDQLTPIGVFKTLSDAKDEAVLLDSSDHHHADDACIYMGFDPIAEFNSQGRNIIINVRGQKDSFVSEPLLELRKFYQRFKCHSDKTLAKFAGGMIGFFSYDAVRLMEEIPDRHFNKNNIPDINFKFYGTHIVFDKRTGKVIIAKIADIDQDSYHQTMNEIDAIIVKLLKFKQIALNSELKQQNINEMAIDLDDQTYNNLVKKAQQYIVQGDAFQIVLSRCFQKNYKGNPFDLYRALRLLNPSPYQFYIQNKHFSLVGSSPERLVSLKHGLVETMPIAGTRKRGSTAIEDQMLEKELLSDEKELAEHMMLVDLSRNDLGSICEPGTVKVVEQSTIKKFSRVMHIVSRVQGKLQKQFDAIDAIKATFPAGTLSGAPKIRAMEIIDELETSKRGVYGGAVCAIDNEGQMDSCITIRTIFLKDNVATVRAGAGIVMDSIPQNEADETRKKAQAVLEAIDLAHRGFI